MPCTQAVRGNVEEVINQKDQRGIKASLLKDLDLEQVRDAPARRAVLSHAHRAVCCYSTAPPQPLGRGPWPHNVRVKSCAMQLCACMCDAAGCLQVALRHGPVAHGRCVGRC